MSVQLPTNVGMVVHQLADLLEIPSSELTPSGDPFIAGLDSARLMLLIDRWSAFGLVLDSADLLNDPTREDSGRPPNVRVHDPPCNRGLPLKAHPVTLRSTRVKVILYCSQ